MVNNHANSYESGSAEIQRRMAAVDLKTLALPTQSVGEKDHIVGDATDEIKRLFAVRDDITDEHNALVNERNGLVTEIQGVLHGAGLGAFSELLSGKFHEYGAKAAKAEKMGAMIESAEELHDIVNKMLWHEVKSSFPELRGKPCSSIRSDWKICWSEPDISDMAKDFFGDEEIPEHIKSVLKHLEEHLANAREPHGRH